ncbi:hypothetical protein AKO1_003286, partial [Acrasis kona]
MKPDGYDQHLTSLKSTRFLIKAIVNDMDLNTPLRILFYVSLFMFVFCFWLRLYLHYFGQWLYLNVVAKAPYLTFEPNAVIVWVQYERDWLTFGHECGVVISGVLINMVVFAMFVFFIWVFQCVRVKVPGVGSRFVVLFGVNTLLDPLLILLVDLCYARWRDGDAFKLYWNSMRTEQHGVYGVLTTVMIYGWAFLLTSFLLYYFILYVFMNGQIIDIFRRLHGDEEKFYVPNDHQVSQAEMLFAVDKSLRYRGKGGELRRLLVVEYEAAGDVSKKVQHFIIYTVEVQDGVIEEDERGERRVVVKGERVVKQVYRQFV